MIDIGVKKSFLISEAKKAEKPLSRPTAASSVRAAVQIALKAVFAMSKIRICYSQGESVRFISHLDFLRTITRTFRRAGMPIKYSEGF